MLELADFAPFKAAVLFNGHLERFTDWICHFQASYFWHVGFAILVTFLDRAN